MFEKDVASIGRSSFYAGIPFNFARPVLLATALLVVSALPSSAATLVWTNVLGGSWHNRTNWFPNTVPNGADVAYITNSGSYTVTITNDINLVKFTVGGNGGTPTLVVDNVATLTITNAGTIDAGGIMIASNCWMSGTLNVLTNGELRFAGSGSKVIYSLSINNHGLFTWAGGGVTVGGTPTTVISNAGLWQITGIDGTSYGGGKTPFFDNSGTIRKSAGNGNSSMGSFTFTNEPGAVVDVLAGNLYIGGSGTNIAGGSFSATSPGILYFYGATWTDAGGVASGTGLIQFDATTLNLRTNIIPGLKLYSGDIYITGTNTFQQNGVITNLAIDGASLRGTNRLDNGIITMTTGSILEQLTVQTNGQLIFTGAGNKLLYSATIINQGTVSMSSTINVGGTPTTVVSNGGLWQITGDASVAFGGGQIPVWTNAGTLRKTTGSGYGTIDANFFNTPSGLVDSQSGSIHFGTGTASSLGGTFNVAASAFVDLSNGSWTDAGGVVTGAGTCRLNGATFNFRTNTIPGLHLLSGTVNITGTNTFQAAGAITNLTLEGATFQGTNAVSGLLTMTSGSMLGQLTIQPSGQLVFTNFTTKFLSSFTLLNRGLVNWAGGSLYCGGTPTTVISNGGTWQITTNDLINWSTGSIPPVWTNTGTVIKNAGTGVAQISGFNFQNQASGLVEVDTGTLQLNFTNSLGALRLNGGTLTAGGTLSFLGGTFDGAGTLGANSLIGGIISPGLSGPGKMNFSSSLNIGSNATIIIDGVGTIPGTQYDQLSVTGQVALSNCTLQVTSLPTVAPGTTFMIITNDGADAVVGTFKGLPENSLFYVGAQPFRIHYAAGSGNDVALVREAIPILSTGGTGLTNGTWNFSGTGGTSTFYNVQFSTDLVNWLDLGTATTDTNGHFNFSDPNASQSPYRFYRVLK